MRTAQKMLTATNFYDLVDQLKMKEAVENVYVSPNGNSIYEIKKKCTFNGTDYIFYIERKASKNNAGYMQVGCKGSVTLVHRLVALAFVPNPDHEKEVDHADGNKLNNHYWNLRWVSHSHNMKLAARNGQLNKNLTYHGRYNEKKGLFTDKDGNKIPMTKDEYIIWRMEHGYRVSPYIKEV